MAEELKPVDTSRISRLRGVVDLATNMNEARHMRQADKDLVSPASVENVRKKSSRERPVTREDALFRLIGIGESGISDISENKHKHLAAAYHPKE